ncbi:MAG: cystathionine beta-lyase [Rhodovibrionaceae bacterium]|nr:cystathionine beta-lyase [Rhodovibrionaceae bacterium]
MAEKPKKPETLLTTLGRDPHRYSGVVNTPVFHASTILAESLEEYESRPRRRFDKAEPIYGLLGTPTTFALEEAICELEGGERAVALPSGLAAVTLCFIANASAGGHVLVSDHVYLPSRKFCTDVLSRMGVEVTFYDPMIGGEIEQLIRRNTQLVFAESPGSGTFEVQDVPAIAAAAHAKGVPLALDNSWATPLFFRGLEHGADIVVHAATKYLSGHADVMMGLVVANAEMGRRLVQTSSLLGFHAAPDDCYLTLRGMRSLAPRLRQHEATGLRLATWLEDRAEVARVLHPALPSCPGHDIWKRDFQGAGSLFSFVLDRPYSKQAIAAMLEGYELFGIGSSWGAYQSLMIPFYPEKIWTATSWDAPGLILRVFAGLEHPDDLIADLDAGFERLRTADD